MAKFNFNVMMAGTSFRDICGSELHWDGVYLTQEPRGGTWNGICQEAILKWMALDATKERYILEISLFDANQEKTPWYQLAENLEQQFYFNREKISIRRFTRWDLSTVSEINGVVVTKTELKSILKSFDFDFEIEL